MGTPPIYRGDEMLPSYVGKALQGSLLNNQYNGKYPTGFFSVWIWIGPSEKKQQLLSSAKIWTDFRLQKQGPDGICTLVPGGSKQFVPRFRGFCDEGYQKTITKKGG